MWVLVEGVLKRPELGGQSQEVWHGFCGLDGDSLFGLSDLRCEI